MLDCHRVLCIEQNPPFHLTRFCLVQERTTRELPTNHCLDSFNATPSVRRSYKKAAPIKQSFLEGLVALGPNYLAFEDMDGHRGRVGRRRKGQN